MNYPYSFLRKIITMEAGGAHHSVNAPSLTTEYMEDFARMAGIEIVVIK